MSLFVVDASVGIKWFVPESEAAIAQRWQDPAHQLHMPTFFDVEVANIVWKKRRRGELTRAEGRRDPDPTPPFAAHPAR